MLFHGTAKCSRRTDKAEEFIGIFGTKERSVIRLANKAGIAAIAAQQFVVAEQILRHGLVPILEPEVLIKSPEKAAAEADSPSSAMSCRRLWRRPTGRRSSLRSPSSPPTSTRPTLTMPRQSMPMATR